MKNVKAAAIFVRNEALNLYWRSTPAYRQAGSRVPGSALSMFLQHFFAELGYCFIKVSAIRFTVLFLQIFLRPILKIKEQRLRNKDLTVYLKST